MNTEISIQKKSQNKNIYHMEHRTRLGSWREKEREQGKKRARKRTRKRTRRKARKRAHENVAVREGKRERETERGIERLLRVWNIKMSPLKRERASQEKRETGRKKEISAACGA